MSPEPTFIHDVSRYEPLGLVANPFAVPPRGESEVAVSLEILAAANQLLSLLVSSAKQEKAKPIMVIKSTDIPAQYALRAVGYTEQALIHDSALNVLHAYIQLYMMRRGRVRSTLGVVGERLAFRDFEKTLTDYVGVILSEPDESLASYQILGPGALEEFAQEYAEDPLGTILDYFGQPELERRPELTEVADLRLTNLEENVDEAEDSAELDQNIGYAPGTGVALPEGLDSDEEVQRIIDYLIEYSSTHLSKVIARGLRMYRERGLSALSTELKVTRAPRKTLKAVAELASVHFDKLAIIYDGFESWTSVASEMRQKIIGALSEMRWMLEDAAVFAFLLERDSVPEVEEQFGSGPRIEWDFPGLVEIQQAPDTIHHEIVGRWLQGAAAPGQEPLTLEDPVLAALVDASQDRIATFATAAAAAIENAATRGVSALDSEAKQAGFDAMASADE